MKAVLPILAIMAAIAPAGALGQAHDAPIGEMSERAHDVRETDERHARDLLIVPIPQSNPTLGSGLTLVGVLFYNPNQSARPWTTGAGAMYTSNGSWAVGAVHSMALARDRFRVVAFAGYADINVKFYGIGPNAGDRDVSIDLNESGFAAMLQGQIRVADHLYAGARYQFLDLTTRIENPDPIFPDLDIPPAELESRMSAIGPIVTYDRRDSAMNPRDGELIQAAWMFNTDALGSDFSYDKFTLAANLYRRLGSGTVIAARASLCGVSRGGPFYDLCLYGASSDLRGYETGRYRDQASWAAQVELRQHLFGRFGAAAFVGVGGVSPSLDHLTDTKFLPAAGIGLRFRPSRQTDINLRLDFAVGRDSNALYFSIGEAF